MCLLDKYHIGFLRFWFEKQDFVSCGLGNSDDCPTRDVVCEILDLLWLLPRGVIVSTSSPPCLPHLLHVKVGDHRTQQWARSDFKCPHPSAHTISGLSCREVAGLGSQEWCVLCILLRVFRGVVPRLMALFRVAGFPLNKLFQVGALNIGFGGIKKRQILGLLQEVTDWPGQAVDVANTCVWSSHEMSQKAFFFLFGFVREQTDEE